ncbi:SMI1/KNR4 family protein [Streptomyces sp. NPDC102394]|uniref:SMI1/KNR4 family protein n=1 Tax=Streptomyces sp. NPDC102394 TaxID=3366167 RepID=UPI003807ED01
MSSDADPLRGTWYDASVRSRVAVMARHDPEHRRFGASHHHYRLHPPLSRETISSFERLHGITLPASYRGFLGSVAGGGAGPYYGLLGLAEEVDDQEALFDLRAECLEPGFLAAPFPHTTGRPGPGKGGSADYSVAGTLVLGEVGCGAFSRLIITGGRAGQVWLDDRSWGGLTPGPDFGEWYTAWLASAS